jgi:hypothetical protein
VQATQSDGAALDASMQAAPAARLNTANHAAEQAIQNLARRPRALRGRWREREASAWLGPAALMRLVPTRGSPHGVAFAQTCSKAALIQRVSAE